MNLPAEWEAFRTPFEAALRPCRAIEAVPGATEPWQSKFCGRPYMPSGSAWPLGKDGLPLFHLAQINFAEMPPLEGFPTRGILQFFICATDSLMGLDFEDRLASDAQVLFWPEPLQDSSALQQDFSFLPDFPHAPSTTESSLLFSETANTIPLGTIDFDKTFGENFFVQFGEEGQWAMRESYQSANPPLSCQVGGYPVFCQDDPRTGAFSEFDVLLLQIGSGARTGFQWGDMGVCNFFIRSTDLSQENFAQVLYNWDCY